MCVHKSSDCDLASLNGVLLPAPEYLMWMQRLQVMGLLSQPFGPGPQRHHSRMKLLHCQNQIQLQHQSLKLQSACTMSTFAAGCSHVEPATLQLHISKPTWSETARISCRIRGRRCEVLKMADGFALVLAGFSQPARLAAGTCRWHCATATIFFALAVIAAVYVLSSSRRQVGFAQSFQDGSQLGLG